MEGIPTYLNILIRYMWYVRCNKIYKNIHLLYTILQIYTSIFDLFSSHIKGILNSFAIHLKLLLRLLAIRRNTDVFVDMVRVYLLEKKLRAIEKLSLRGEIHILYNIRLLVDAREYLTTKTTTTTI